MASAQRAVREEATPLQPGQRLPRLSLPAVPDGRPVALREPARGAPVIAVLPSAAAEDGEELLQRFAREYEALRVWAGRPLVIVRGSLEEATRLVGEADGVPFPVLADVEGRAHRRLGVRDGWAGLVIADRWGVVYHADEAERAGDLPPLGEAVEWVRYLATQCPECGVPDEPGRGEWAP